MKKFLFGLLACLLLGLSSCSKDEEKTKDYAEPFVGKWVQTFYKSSSTGTFIGQEDGTYIEFKANGTFTFFLGSVFNETTTGTYSVPYENHIVLNPEGEKEATISVYDFEGNNATFQFLLFNTGTYKMQKR